MDTGRIFDTIMDTIRTADQGARDEVDKKLVEFETETGIKVRDGIIASLAGPVTMYTVHGGSSMDMPYGGIVVIADLKDTALFEKNVAALGNYIAGKSNGQLQISTQTAGDRKLNIWMIPQAAMAQIVPTWTIVNGKFVFATSQTLCKSAADRAASPVAAKSLSALPQFRAVTANLPKGVLCVRYLDNRVYFKTMMGQVQRFWPMVTMATAQSGVALPFMLPDLSQYADQMTPSISYSWFDKDGVRGYVRGAGVEQAIGGVAAVAIGAAVITPALAKAKTTAKKAQGQPQSQDTASADNLKQVGVSMKMYADKHEGAYPKELADLIRDAGLSPQSLVCKRKPKNFIGQDYIYVTGLTSKAPATSVLVYENPVYCNFGWLNVLYSDGHIEWIYKDKFRADLKKTYDTLGQPVPTVRFGSKKSSSKPAEPNKP
jgi:hypothetical protein